MEKLYKRLIDKYEKKEKNETEKREGFLEFEVSFYIVTWNNKNQHDEVFLKGSEVRSLDAFRKGEIKYFKNHDWDVPGIVKNMYADEVGLVVEVDLIDTTIGRDTKTEYETGVISQHSAGFHYVENGTTYDRNTDTLFINDFLLREASAITGWASDKNTSVINMNAAIAAERKEILKSLGFLKPELNFDKFNFKF